MKIMSRETGHARGDRSRQATARHLVEILQKLCPFRRFPVSGADDLLPNNPFRVKDIRFRKSLRHEAVGQIPPGIQVHLDFEAPRGQETFDALRLGVVHANRKHHRPVGVQRS